MARVTGPSRDELDARGNEFAQRVRRAIRRTLNEVAGTTTSVGDLQRIRKVWRTEVAALTPHLRSAWNTAVEGIRTQLEKISERERQALTSALVFDIPKVKVPNAEDFLANATNRLVGIGDHVWEVARDELLTGLKLGEGVAELRERVVESVNVSYRRAATIARTEINSAMNNGAYAQMQLLDVTTVKEWIATNDSRTRESHAAVDGEEIDGDAKFMVGGHPMDHPHDLTAPPGETINCRCTLAWDIVDDDDEDDDDVDLDDDDEDDDDVDLDDDDEDDDDDDDDDDGYFAAQTSFHLPGQHDQDSHGRRGSASGAGRQRLDALKNAYAQGYVVDEEITSGSSNASLAILTLADGSRVVRKTLKKNETRREYLAGRVFDALKSDESQGVTTAQLNDNTIITTYAPGQTGSERLEGILDKVRGYDASMAATQKEHTRQAKLPGAKEMAMLDALVENHDRHSLNWILSGDRLEPIDQGAARFASSYIWNAQGEREESIPTSAVGDYWFGISEFDSGVISEINPRYTRDDIARYRVGLAEIRDEFESDEEREWFDFISNRLDKIEARITS